MYVVAGVTGHVGSVVAKDLLAGKHKVKVIVRSAEKGAAWSKQGAEVAVGALGSHPWGAEVHLYPRTCPAPAAP